MYRKWSVFIHNFITKTSIRYKFLAGMLLASAVPVIIVTILTSLNIHKDIQKRVLESNKDSVLFSNKSMEDMIKQFSVSLYALEVNPQLKIDLAKWNDENPFVQYAAQASLQNQLLTTLHSDRRIDKIELYSIISQKILAADYSRTYIMAWDPENADLWSRDDTLQNNYFKQINGQVCVLRKINRFEDRKRICEIVFQLNQQVMDDFFNLLVKEKGEQAFLLNDENEIIAKYPEEGGTREDIEPFIARMEKNNEKENFFLMNNNYVFFTSSKDGRLKLIKTVSIQAVTYAPLRNIQIGIIIGFICTCIALLMAAFLSKVISKPVVKLANTMGTLDLNDFRAPESSKRNDEIGLLEDGFESMLKRMNELINIEYRNKIATRTAQLNALQSQINPHFLNNTLQLIGGLSLKKDSMGVYRITLALSTIMRYSMNFGNDIVKMEEELKYLDNYLFIQNQRFGGRFEFSNEIPKELFCYMIPKLCLQPIIENCFEHGFERGHISGTEPWYIRITGYIDNGRIIINVFDNGGGISSEKLEEIKENLKAPIGKQVSDHIGLKNVDTRLKLQFGEEYGIEIHSVLNKGTKIILCFKAISEVKPDEL